MDFPIRIDTISMELSLCIIKASWLKILKRLVLLSLKIVFTFLNSADTDEMPPYAAFHLGLHCLPKYLLTGIKNEKG